MWELLLESCAELLGLTVRERRGQLFVACVAAGLVGLICLEIWGEAGLLVPGAMIVIAAAAARQVVSARDAAWRAACLHLDDPRQAPARPSLTSAMPATARALRRLGAAIDDARRGRHAEAHEAIPHIDRAVLRVEELRLLDAVRALISLGLDDRRTAAQIAVTALPTGSEGIDACLGRIVIAEAWHAPDSLRRIQADWEGKGVAPDQDGTLARLHRLTRLRIDERLLDDVGAAEARSLSGEAREVGDEDLAADLESRARERAYR